MSVEAHKGDSGYGELGDRRLYQMTDSDLWQMVPLLNRVMDIPDPVAGLCLSVPDCAREDLQNTSDAILERQEYFLVEYLILQVKINATKDAFRRDELLEQRAQMIADFRETVSIPEALGEGYFESDEAAQLFMDQCIVPDRDSRNVYHVQAKLPKDIDDLQYLPFSQITVSFFQEFGMIYNQVTRKDLHWIKTPEGFVQMMSRDFEDNGQLYREQYVYLDPLGEDDEMLPWDRTDLSYIRVVSKDISNPEDPSPQWQPDWVVVHQDFTQENGAIEYDTQTYFVNETAHGSRNLIPYSREALYEDQNVWSIQVKAVDRMPATHEMLVIKSGEISLVQSVFYHEDYFSLSSEEIVTGVRNSDFVPDIEIRMEYQYFDEEEVFIDHQKTQICFPSEKGTVVDAVTFVSDENRLGYKVATNQGNYFVEIDENGRYLGLAHDEG